MSEVNKDIQRIESIYNEAVKLAEQGFVEPALIYARKMIEGILIIMNNKESISSSNIEEMSNLGGIIYEIKIYVQEKQKTKDSIEFFAKLSDLYYLGNRLTHFTLEEPERKDAYDNIVSSLDFIFKWFCNYINTQRESLERKDLYFNEKNDAIPLCLKYIGIRGYNNLNSVELDDIPVDAKFIVLTGDNGTGKTSILQAIAIGMYGDYDEYSNLVLSNQKNISIELVAKEKDKIITNQYRGFKNRYTELFPNYKLIAYGASRLQLQSAESQDTRNLRQSNIYGIFKVDNILRSIEHWIQSGINIRSNDLILSIKSLLIKLMPSITDIKIRFKEHDKYVDFMDRKKISIWSFPKLCIHYIENDRELESEMLSSGNKNILAMVGDMVIRLCESQPNVNDVRNLYGIVLIDELETHLHPKWQKEFPRLLADCFPLVQFIITTHSPMVFLGMPKNSVFYNITYNENNETIAQRLDIDIENVMPHEILTSPLFGMENLRNVNNKGIEYLSVETTQEKEARLKKEAEIKELAAKFKLQIIQGE